MSIAPQTRSTAVTSTIVLGAVAVTSAALLTNPAATVGAFALAAVLVSSWMLSIAFPAVLLAGAAFIYLAAGPAIVAGVLPASVAQLGTFSGLAAAVLVVVQRLYAERTAADPAVRFPEITWGLGVFVVLVCVGVANPALPSLGYGISGARPLITPLVVLLAARHARLSHRDVQLILLAVAAGWGVNLLFAFRQSFVGFTAAENAFLRSGVSTFLVGDDARLLGAMRTNQDFGVTTAIAFPLLLAFSLLSRGSRRWVQLLLWAATAATAYVMAASLLRSTMVGGVLAASLVLVLASSSPLGRRRVGILVAVVVATIAAMGLASAGIDTSGDGRTAAAVRRITTIFDLGGDKAFQARATTTWPIALDVLGSHPLGAGPGAAGPVSQQRTDAPFGTLTPDNGYLLVALQVGIPGLVLFVWFAFGTVARLMRQGRCGDPLVLGVGGSLFAVLVAMVTGGIWGLVGPVSVLCLLIGLASRPDRLASVSSPKSPK